MVHTIEKSKDGCRSDTCDTFLETLQQSGACFLTAHTVKQGMLQRVYKLTPVLALATGVWLGSILASLSAVGRRL